jgi:cobalamin biosynthetic protein CobC
MRPQLQAASERLQTCLETIGSVKRTPLFATLQTPDSHALHGFLAERGILTRHYPDQPLLRLGLPASEADWQRLNSALAAWSTR